MKTTGFCLSGAFAWVVMISGCGTTTTTTITPQQSQDWSAAERADVHAQLAAQYMERDVLKTANKELDRALAIMPTHSRSNYVMAVLQTRLREYDKANEYYKRALKSDPKNSEAAHDYGIFLCNRGKVEQALNSFEQALSNPLYSGTVLTELRAGECLVTTGADPTRAEKYFSAALQSNPGIPSALYYMAEINLGKKNFLSARGYIERFFSVSEETPESLLLAATIESELKAHDVAKDYVRRLKAKFPSSKQAAQVRGML